MSADITDTEELPEDTVRRYAHKLINLEKMVDDELERVRRTDDLPQTKWWQFRLRAWVEGVSNARGSAEMKLWPIKSEFYG